MAKRACLSVDEVVVAIDEESEDGADYEFDDDEPIMEGSDEEFGEFDDELRDQIEVDEMESVREECVLRFSDDENHLGEEEEQQPVPLPSEWSNELTRVHIPPFSSPVGPKIDVPDTPLGVFEVFHSEEIVLQTNNYARQVLGDGFSRYRPLTVQEIRAYFGFCMLMAINRLPATEDYWKRDPIYNYSPIASRISHDRFREIGRCLHFVDNANLVPRGDQGYDRLGKIRPLIQHLLLQFQAVYSPHRDVAVDEAMIKFQGRSSLKQYMPLKPTKRGNKSMGFSRQSQWVFLEI